MPEKCHHLSRRQVARSAFDSGAPARYAMGMRFDLITPVRVWAVAFWLAGSALLPGAATNAFFQTAQPVWPEGRQTEKNLTAGFRARFDAAAGETVTLRLAASTLYRVYVNGQFTGHGPARAGHGSYRVDEWDLTGGCARGAQLGGRGGGRLQREQLLSAGPTVLFAGRSRRRRPRRRFHGRPGRALRRVPAAGPGPEDPAIQFPAPLLGGLESDAWIRPVAPRPRGPCHALQMRGHRP